MIGARAACALCAAGAWLLLAGGCGRKAEKCQEAREASATAWQRYAQAMEQGVKTARANQSQAQAQSGAVEKRLAPAVQKVADSRYPRSSSAWLLAYQTAYEDACKKDAECKQLRELANGAKVTLGYLADRIPRAHAAHAAAREEAEAARTAAKAVVGHPVFAEYQQAQALSVAAYKACEGVAPAPSPVIAARPVSGGENVR